MWTVLLSAINFLSGGAFDKIVTAVVGIVNKKTEAQIVAMGVGKDALASALQANIELNKQKIEQTGWWGAKLIILIAGVPSAVHFGAVMLDSTFRFGWGIPKVPPPYDSYEWAIVQSFFLVMPAMTLVGGFVQWLTKR